MNNIPEKHREVAHAWVDGAVIEVSPKGKNNWWVVNDPEFHEGQDYRVRPKPKVKKWRWVRESIYDGLAITQSHHSEERAYHFGYLQKIDSTLIEVDAK